MQKRSIFTKGTPNGAGAFLPYINNKFKSRIVFIKGHTKWRMNASPVNFEFNRVHPSKCKRGVFS
jgi:hypothetical protein